MRLKLAMAVLILVPVAMAQANAKKSSDAENRIRALDSEWSQAAQSKDVDKMVSYYSDDASAFPFNAPIATGKEQIRQLWSALMAKPGFSLSFAPTKIDVAKSNDLAYEAGTFELKMNDAQNNPTTTNGKYVVCWKKSAKGEWKVQFDIFNTDK
ncbi:MAG TPA: DUF4440 domain-containing protein [Terriglobales bacterium]|jgi:uncharacterized protein (TIGR02246 family)|nr:DUF4440 domain-containing protein [Terriglobales bacterium]